MSSLVINNILRFIGLIVFQIIILNNVYLSSWIYPMVYPIIIIMLPVNLPRWSYLFIGFSCGMVVDMFTHTPGLHASAALFLAWITRMVLSMFVPRDGLSFVGAPTIYSIGLQRFLWYCAFSVLAHHIWFFLLESLSFKNLGFLLLRILASSIVSLALSMLFQFLFAKRVRVR